MRSAGLLALVTATLGSGTAHISSWCAGSQAGEPVEQSGVLVPFGQVVGDDLGVGGLEGLALGLGGGALWRSQISELSE